MPSKSSAEVMVVTGGSSGIGRAICERLAATGAHIYAASRTACTCAGCTHLTMDVTDDASVQGAIGEIVRREGRIDALVSCAGMSLTGPIEDTTIEEAQRQLDVNFFGTVRVIRAVLPAMRRQRSGKIVVVGSIGGLIGLPYLGHYSASKFALDGLIEALRAEIAPFGIEATILHPGEFKTSLAARRVTSANAGAQSAYHGPFEHARAFYGAVEAKAPPPLAVARKVQSLLARRRLPTRALVGSPLEVLGVWAKGLLPPGGFEALFRLAYGP